MEVVPKPPLVAVEVWLLGLRLYLLVQDPSDLQDHPYPTIFLLSTTMPLPRPSRRPDWDSIGEFQRPMVVPLRTLTLSYGTLARFLPA